MKASILALLLTTTLAFSQNSVEQDIIDIEEKLIEWRQYFHQNPELSNQEFKTAEKIAEHLKSLGLEVETGVSQSVDLTYTVEK